jgi:hypothetical protein
MNKTMFWLGIAIVAVSALILLASKQDSAIGAMAIIGIILIGSSGYRPLSKKK